VRRHRRRPIEPQTSTRRAQRERVVLAVRPHDDGWAVEQEGRWFDQSQTREEAKAAANKHARQLFDDGRPCQVVVQGETGYFGHPYNRTSGR